MNMQGIRLFIIGCLTVLSYGKSLHSNAKKANIQSFKNEYLESLPKNYEGIDQLNLFKLYKNRAIDIEKDEFETQEEFANRFDSITAINPVLSKDSLYAFSLKIAKFKYNAENQEYEIKDANFSPYECYETSSSPNPGWITCPTILISEKRHTSIQSNAFGTEVEVSEVSRVELGVAIPKLGCIGRDFLEKGYDSYSISKKIPLEKDVAKKFKGKTISAIFVGHPTSLQIIKGRGEFSQPRLDFPYEFTTDEFAIPINPEWIIIYAKETGEIIEKFDISEPKPHINSDHPAPF